MNDLSRRAFSQQTLGSLLTFTLLESLFETDAFGGEIKPVAAKWLSDLHELGQDVKGEKLKQTEWQKKVEKLFHTVDLPELLKFIDFKKLTKGLKLKDRGEKSLRAKFPRVEGLPTRFVFGHQIFALKKDRSVVPHGHNNMATAFLILDGEFQGKHYDRLKDEKKHMIVKPTIDGKFKVGQYSTVSDQKDNVHWFKTTSQTGFIFNIHVLGIDEDRRSGRVYVDPNGEKISGGNLRVRKIGASEAYKLYG